MKKQEKRKRQKQSPFTEYIAPILTAALILSLAACSATDTKLYESDYGANEQISYSAAQRVNVNTLRLGWSSQTSVNPFYIKANLNYNMICLIYQSLYKTDSAYIPYEQLAAGYTVKDPKTVSVKMRSDAHFSDSTSVTAQDAVYSFNQAKNSELYSKQLSNIESATASSTYELTFKLASPDKYAANALTFPIVKTGTASSEDSVPIGSGMFRFDSDRLTANPSYNGDKPGVGVVELYPISESATLALALESGNIDCVFDDLSSGSYIKAAASTTAVNLNNLVFIGLNSEKQALAIPQVRQAVNFAVNKVEIASDAYSGFAKAAYTVFNPAWSEYFNSGISEAEMSLNYDSASQLLTSAGYPQCNFTLIVNSDNTFRCAAADSIKESLKNAGINLTVSKLSWADYSKALSEGNYDMYLGEMKFPDNMDISALFSVYGVAQSSPSAAAFAKYKSSDITMRDFISIFNSDMPVVPVCYRQGVFVYSRSISGRLDCTYDNLFKNLPEWTITAKKNNSD